MFQDYVEEISNPDHRAEQEAYLAQMERDGEAPKDVNLVRPEVRTSITGTAVLARPAAVVEVM